MYMTECRLAAKSSSLSQTYQSTKGPPESNYNGGTRSYADLPSNTLNMCYAELPSSPRSWDAGTGARHVFA